MIIKAIVIILFLLIIASLVSALMHLVNNKGDDRGIVRALTARIALSVFAFIFLIICAQLGWIEPHGLGG
jgi:hypothetical protein